VTGEYERNATCMARVNRAGENEGDNGSDDNSANIIK
jgi:hypothetical protein